VTSRTRHVARAIHASSVRTLLFALALATSLPLFAQDVAHEATESDLPGVYRLSTPNDRAQALIDEAIDTGVESMGPLRSSSAACEERDPTRARDRVHGRARRDPLRPRSLRGAAQRA